MSFVTLWNESVAGGIHLMYSNWQYIYTIRFDNTDFMEDINRLGI